MLTATEASLAKRLAAPSSTKSIIRRQRQQPSTHPSLQRSRSYAAQTSLGKSTLPSAPRHKRVTVFNDDGRVKWGDLTAGEKAARTTQQGFNFGLIGVGAVGTILVFTYLWTDVFSPSSATIQFNRAVDTIRKNPDAVALLGGPGPNISAFGEATWNRWRRNRPIAHRVETDVNKVERLHMHFNVQGSERLGVARMMMIRRPEHGYFRYGYLYIDVPGKERVWVEREQQAESKKSGGSSKILGIKWS